ncbi:hypothetical protein L208DRAFT_1393454 [Tricholoma matsutake]|nr:hypothetical protein L208DRAFT_1393454 [Tricholoma matsutake 945]
MGFDVETFHHLLEGRGRFAERWELSTIPRNDVAIIGEPRLGNRSLDAAGGLGLVLHYLGSAMLEITLQHIFVLTPSTVSRYLDFAKHILLQMVRSMKEGAIRLPRTPQEFAAESALVCECHSMLEGVFGVIDGLALLAQEADSPEVENATYNGWKSDHTINNVIAYSPRGVIISAVLNAPGSWHDSHVARPIFHQLLTKVPDSYFLVSHTGFPHGTALIAGKIRAPVKEGEYISEDPYEQEEFLQFNRQLLSHRQSAEWGNCMLQGSFGRLRVPLDINAEQDRQHF